MLTETRKEKLAFKVKKVNRKIQIELIFVPPLFQAYFQMQKLPFGCDRK